jgi:hypothetical protein
MDAGDGCKSFVRRSIMYKIIPDGNVFNAEKTFEKILEEAYFVKLAGYRVHYQGFPRE